MTEAPQTIAVNMFDSFIYKQLQNYGSCIQHRRREARREPRPNSSRQICDQPAVNLHAALRSNKLSAWNPGHHRGIRSHKNGLMQRSPKSRRVFQLQGKNVQTSARRLRLSQLAMPKLQRISVANQLWTLFCPRLSSRLNCDR